MVDSVKRNEKLEAMNEIDIALETIDTLNDKIVLYKKHIENLLSKITKDEILQSQIKESMVINF